jgi:hypothetical protein
MISKALSSFPPIRGWEWESSLDGSSPVLFPPPGDIGRRRAHSKDLQYPYWLYSLSPLFCRVATGNLAGRILPCICPYPCRGGDKGHGTDLTDDTVTYIQTNILFSIFLHKTSSSYQTFTISWPCQLIDVSCPTPNLSPLISRSSHPASNGSLGKMGLFRWKMSVSPTKNSIAFSIYKLSPVLHA